MNPALLAFVLFCLCFVIVGLLCLIFIKVASYIDHQQRCCSNQQSMEHSKEQERALARLKRPRYKMKQRKTCSQICRNRHTLKQVEYLGKLHRLFCLWL